MAGSQATGSSANDHKIAINARGPSGAYQKMMSRSDKLPPGDLP